MTPFLLFVMAILLILIFWELSKIHTRLKMGPRSQMESTKKREETTGIKVAWYSKLPTRNANGQPGRRGVWRSHRKSALVLPLLRILFKPLSPAAPDDGCARFLHSQLIQRWRNNNNATFLAVATMARFFAFLPARSNNFRLARLF